MGEEIDNEIRSSTDKPAYTALIWFPPGMCIPSTNYLYKPGIRNKRFPYLYKHESVVIFQQHLVRYGEQTDLQHLKALVPAPTSLDLSLIFLIRDRFWSRDVSNMVKSVEDGIVKIIGIDDSRVVRLTAEKQRQLEKQEGIRINIWISP